ncbi:Mediator of RNA polymerase II transcription subunit 14 [Erysiphe neolycopersici]|uniref:Mediator of RNA polymerase II transcription subunit 14 n=1 Tax=Erysiphe neolycopersici TaxID=212602 RepID=A0A420I0Y1_9PEZI|nr:Mediator of RNA polymerase II transcription subunit 14 [Erysiphe neolycopersici]
MADDGSHTRPQSSHVDIKKEKSAELSSKALQRPMGKNNDLPSEILHITQGYISLKTLIARLAQKTHRDLLKTVKDLAQMPTTYLKANSNGSQVMAVDDTSAENLAKKLRILKFVTEAHEAWTKALVITGWSRKAEDVSKIIDLKVHLDARLQDYVAAIDQMAHDKRGYIHARLPNPDIKTALEVMETGKASWMPQLGYIPPPQLDAYDIMEVFADLNTILSTRLQLNEYDTLPYYFKNFRIKSGRVTFIVAGEFELDLTIAEEAPEAQYWFLDLRFIFSPSLKILSPNLRFYLENKINEILSKDGLSGCYNFLHDLVLTYKINELRRQAVNLANHRWIHSVKVEVLNRSICIQYWIDRFHKAPKENKIPKNWLILGVHSGNTKTTGSSLKVTRRLGVRWFRESKEQKDVNIPIDDVDLSAELLLTTVTSKHITFILTSICEKLQSKPLYANQDLSLSLHISENDSVDSELKVQLTADVYLSVRIEPVSGLFIFEPPTRRIFDFQRRLNAVVVDPANRAHEYIEQLRYALLYDSLLAHGWTTGFKNLRNPGVNALEMKRVFKDAAQVHWYKRAGWPQECYLTISFNAAGENWSLVQTAIVSDPTNPKGVMVIPTQIKMPVLAVSPKISYKFMISIYVFSVALLSYYGNLKYLWSRRHLYMLIPNVKREALNIPFIYIKLSDLLTSLKNQPSTSKPWVKDFVRLSFHGVQSFSQLSILEKTQESDSQALGAKTQSNPTKEEREDQAIMIADVLMRKPIPRPLVFVQKDFDRDIVFYPTAGTFSIRLYGSIGTSLIADLTKNLVKIERLVNYIRVLEKYETTLICTKICLNKLSFSYKGILDLGNDGNTESTELVYRAAIGFSSENENHLFLEFEKGNPHIRIADYLTILLNSSLGLDGVAKVIPLTTLVLQVIEAIEEAWAKPAIREYGMVIVNARAADWYIIRYILTNQKSNTPNIIPQSQKFLFEVRMCNRKGEAWWHVRRYQLPKPSIPFPSEESENRVTKQNDLDEALGLLWKMSGKNWQGMRVGAVSRCEGIIELLTKVDKIVQDFSMKNIKKRKSCD